MRYIVVVNDDERIDAGDEWTLEETTYEIGELLRSGYFEVESVEEINS
jgi:hypothetical protein